MIETLTNFYYKCISIIWHSVHNWIIPFNQRTYYRDRVVAFDASSVIMCIIGIVSVIYNTVSFLDSIMLVAIISFVSSVSISRFIGEVEYSMAQINEIIELIAAFLIFLGSIIAVISAIGIVKFQDVFYEVMHLPRVLRYLSY